MTSLAPAPAVHAAPSPERDLGGTAARGTGVTLLTQGLRVVLQFGSVVALARLLTPADFGRIAMVTSVIGIADLLRDAGLSSAAIQARVLSEAERTNLFWVNLGLGAGSAAVAAASTPLIVRGYGDPTLGPIVLALAVVFVLSGANTQFRADLTRRMRFGPLAVSDVVSQAAGIAVAVALAVAGAGYWAVVAQQVVAAAVALLLNVRSCRWLPGRWQRGVDLRHFFRFGGGLLGTQGIHYATKNVDNIGIGAVLGASPLGLYSRAYQLLMMPLNMVNAPMTRVALPVLARVADDDGLFAAYLAKVQLVACYLTATVFAVAAGLARPLVAVLFGARWYAVAPIFAVLALGGIFRAVSQIAYWIYLARGMPGAQFRLYLWAGPVMVAIILGGLPWGVLGVAVGHSIAYAGLWVVTLVHVGRVTGVKSRPLFANALRAMALVSAPCGLVAWAATLVPAPAVAQLALGATGCAAYLLLVSAVVPVVRADTALVIGFARRAVSR